MADSFDVVLGNVINVVEYYPSSSFLYVRSSVDVCTYQDGMGLDFGHAYDSALVAFDAEQEVKVAVGLQVTYRIQ